MQSSKLSTKQKKILFLSILGTCLEFYDFTLFSVFAFQIGKNFFPSSDPLVSTISALGAFAAGFLMRPIGAIVIGYIGDKYSRRNALSLSIILMGLPALVVSLMPSYETIGIIAPILILLFRLLQGFSAGGEFNGAAIYILENLPQEKKAFYSSLVSSAGGLGAILAFAIGAILSLENMPEYSFRIAFFLGASISFVGFILRIRVKNQTQYPKTHAKSEHISPLKILKTVFKSYQQALFTTFSIGALDGALSYSVAGFISVYLSQFLGITLSSSMGISALCLAFYIIITPQIAKLYDKLKPRKFFKFFFALFVLLIPTAFVLLNTKDILLIILGQLLLALVLSFFSGTQHAFMQNLFPENIRYTGVSFGYNLGTSLLGGSSPMLMTWLLHQTGNLYMPVYYLFALGFLSAFMIFKRITL